MKLPTAATQYYLFIIQAVLLDATLSIQNEQLLNKLQILSVSTCYLVLILGNICIMQPLLWIHCIFRHIIHCPIYVCIPRTTVLFLAIKRESIKRYR